MILKTFIMAASMILIAEFSVRAEPPKWDSKEMSDGCSVPQFAVENSAEIQRVNKKVRDCCVTHDEAYYYGKEPEFPKREKADKALKMCMEEKGEAVAAAMYYLGVRMGGCSVRKQPYRWGFGEDWATNEMGNLALTPIYSENDVTLSKALPCIGK